MYFQDLSYLRVHWLLQNQWIPQSYLIWSSSKIFGHHWLTLLLDDQIYRISIFQNKCNFSESLFNEFQQNIEITTFANLKPKFILTWHGILSNRFELICLLKLGQMISWDVESCLGKGASNIDWQDLLVWKNWW